MYIIKHVVEKRESKEELKKCRSLSAPSTGMTSRFLGIGLLKANKERLRHGNL
jgi:hypothetical protein